MNALDSWQNKRAIREDHAIGTLGQPTLAAEKTGQVIVTHVKTRWLHKPARPPHAMSIRAVRGAVGNAAIAAAHRDIWAA